MACYSWSHQNSEYAHAPHVSVCEWGCIDLHGSRNAAGVHLLCVVLPFPTSFVLWLVDSTRELLSSLHPTGDEYEDWDAESSSFQLLLVNVPNLFLSAACAS